MPVFTAEWFRGAGVDGHVGASYGFEDGAGVVRCLLERGVSKSCADAEEVDSRMAGGEQDGEGVVVAGVDVQPYGDGFGGHGKEVWDLLRVRETEVHRVEREELS